MPASPGDRVPGPLERGLDMANEVLQAVRAHQDPMAVARRRQAKVRRRFITWVTCSVLSAALLASSIGMLVEPGSGGTVGGAVAAVIIFGSLLALCVTAAVRRRRELRECDRVVTGFGGAAQTGLAPQLRPVLAQLDGYSRTLRQLVGMIGLVDDRGTRELRADILAEADRAEQRLRAQAMELSGLLGTLSTAPAPAMPSLESTVTVLTDRIESGVKGYGDLVAAAGEAVAASRQLDSGGYDLTDQSEQLRSLAAGLRDLTGHAS